MSTMPLCKKNKLTNMTKPLKTPGWAAVRLDRHENKGGGRLMLIRHNHNKDMIPFDDNMTALPQSADLHLEQQGIWIMMPNRKQRHIHDIYILPRSSCSAVHDEWIMHLLYNMEMLLIVVDINAHNSRWDTNTNKDKRGDN